MKRGALSLVRKPTGDAKSQRVFGVVGRQTVINSRFSTVICAPVYTRGDGLKTQVNIGPECGLKHDSAIDCDDLASLSKSVLTDDDGTLSPAPLESLKVALRIALDIE